MTALSETALTAADKAEVAQIVGDAIAVAIRPLLDAVAANQRQIHAVKRELAAPIQASGGEPGQVVGVEIVRLVSCADGSKKLLPF
jgi:hypothetical protein